jgi:hypothetical protein
MTPRCITTTKPGGVDPATVLVSRSFANLPGRCLWLNDATSSSNVFTMSFRGATCNAGDAITPGVLRLPNHL